MLRSATIAKIEKKIPNMLACLFSERLQDNPFVNLSDSVSAFGNQNDPLPGYCGLPSDGTI
jgi:hypothetical protein